MTRIAAFAQYSIAGLVGLYLGADQHLAYTAATVAIATVATCAARRSIQTATISANRTEPVESVAVSGVVEHHLDRHVDLDVVGRTVDNVRHHAGALV